ncbi:conserved hypothetical protein, partial [Ricinus communis]
MPYLRGVSAWTAPASSRAARPGMMCFMWMRGLLMYCNFMRSRHRRYAHIFTASVPFAHQPLQFPVLFQREQRAGQALADVAVQLFAGSEVQPGAVHHLRQDAHLAGRAGAFEQLLQAGPAVEVQAAASDDQLVQVQFRARRAGVDLEGAHGGDDVAGRVATVDQHHRVRPQLAHIVPVVDGDVIVAAHQEV